jgi:hypothetical protein
MRFWGHHIFSCLFFNWILRAERDWGDEKEPAGWQGRKILIWHGSGMLKKLLALHRF